MTNRNEISIGDAVEVAKPVRTVDSITGRPAILTTWIPATVQNVDEDAICVCYAGHKREALPRYRPEGIWRPATSKADKSVKAINPSLGSG